MNDDGTGPMPGMTHDAALRAMAAIFRKRGLPTPRLEARFLLEAATGTAGAAVAADRPIDGNESLKLAGMVRRRLGGEPVDRIIGNAEFWSRRFDLNAETLSPRPDTETVVEAALALLAASVVRNPKILDLGTGTGAILITLLAECRRALGTGIDASAAALAMARQNSILNGVEERLSLIEADWRQENWSGSLGGPFDLVVANPPYIPSRDIPGLEHEVRAHDPVLALDGGPDGLQAYRQIARDLVRIIAADGHVVFEIGAGQGKDVTDIMTRSGFSKVGQQSDLGGHVRALIFAPGNTSGGSLRTAKGA